MKVNELGISPVPSVTNHESLKDISKSSVIGDLYNSPSPTVSLIYHIKFIIHQTYMITLSAYLDALDLVLTLSYSFVRSYRIQI